MNIPAEAQSQRLPTSLRVLARMQIPIAVIAVVVSLAAGWRIKPLIEQERTLKDEIAKREVSLRDSKAQLQQAQASLDAERRKLAEIQTDYERHIGDLKKQVETLNQELADTQEQLHSASDVSRHNRPIDMDTAKSVFSRHPAAGPILDRTLEFRRRGVQWKLGGKSPEEGFDSPGFAAFILREMNQLPLSDRQGRDRTSRELMESLRQLTGQVSAIWSFTAQGT